MLQAVDGHAEMKRLAFAEQHGVERAGTAENDGKRGGDGDDDNPDFLPAAGSETAHAPEGEVADLRVVRHVDGNAGEGPGKRVDGNAREQKRRGRRLAARLGKALNGEVPRRCRPQTPQAAEAAAMQEGSAAATAPPNTMMTTAPSAAPPETPIRLGSASGLRKRPWKAAPAPRRSAAADDDGEKGARQPDHLDHGGGALIDLHAEKRADHVADADRHRARRERDDEGETEQRRKPAENGGIFERARRVRARVGDVGHCAFVHGRSGSGVKSCSGWSFEARSRMAWPRRGPKPAR